MYSSIINKEKKIAVIGLGYVGLPIALEFAKHVPVIGFDIKPERVEMMKKGIDPSRELEAKDFENKDISFTSDLEDLKEAGFYIIAVPTPINEHKQPELKPILSASETVGKVLNHGDYVVYESTVYPGCTEEDCVPVLERFSGMTYKTDFKVGYSPERINPGDKKHTLVNITKVSSGCDETSAENIAKVYEIIITAGVHRASSIKVSEAAKIMENTQRDVNIALMNELSMIFNKIGINTFEVLDAAGTKWNFLPFVPGLVGGHCIGVDPYYLLHKAKQLGHHAQIINSGRAINDSMGAYVTKETIKLMLAQDKVLSNAKVLVMGLTFKENVSDIRNTRVIDILQELNDYKVKYDIVDAYANTEEVREEYDIELNEIGDNYDAIILAVNHDEYTRLNEDFFQSISAGKGILVDIKAIFKDRIKKMTYWSL
ncbi:MAG: nucleotide sugar dehydrogenase [Candidatus Delongbacteria bacterium]|jgi:UDP-N-acetyl-D-galactosamine dehydrogenase|nr:nucleotide sugar dehydrogenase [Candidatus Delongbacteria bacterium]